MEPTEFGWEVVKWPILFSEATSLLKGQKRLIMTIQTCLKYERGPMVRYSRAYAIWSLVLRKNQHFFRQINVLTKEVTKELISRKFFSVIAFYSSARACRTFIFYVKSILKNSEIVTRPLFAILGALNLVNFSLQKAQKVMKNQNSEPLNVLEWPILRLYVCKFTTVWKNEKYTVTHKNFVKSTL